MCYGMVLQPSSQNWHTNGVWALWLLSFPSMCFFQCPQQAPKSQHSQGFKLKFVMIAYHVLPKKLHNSGNFPHWLQLCTRGLLRNSANSPNSMKFGEFAEWQKIRRIRRISCFIKRWVNVVFQTVVYGSQLPPGWMAKSCTRVMRLVTVGRSRKVKMTYDNRT